MWEVEGIEGCAWGCSPAAEKSWVGRISEVNTGERCGRAALSELLHVAAARGVGEDGSGWG
jgi:hypothetical protein